MRSEQKTYDKPFWDVLKKKFRLSLFTTLAEKYSLQKVVPHTRKETA